MENVLEGGDEDPDVELLLPAVGGVIVSEWVDEVDEDAQVNEGELLISYSVPAAEAEAEAAAGAAVSLDLPIGDVIDEIAMGFEWNWSVDKGMNKDILLPEEN